MKLTRKVRLVIENEDGKIFNKDIYYKTLTKKQNREIQEIVLDAQNTIEEDALGALDEVEEAAKLKFGYAVKTKNPEDLDVLREIAEDYGYQIIISEIEELLGGN